MKQYYVEQINEAMKENGMEFFLQRVLPQSLGTEVHIHEAIEILYIKEGSFRIFVNDTEHLADKGDIILLRSNAIHRIYSNSLPVNEYYVLKVKPSMIFELASQKNAVGYVLRFVVTDNEGKSHWSARKGEGQGISRALEQLITEFNGNGLCKDMSLLLCASQVILSFLRDLMRNENDHNSKVPANDNAASQIYKVIKYINQNYAEDIDADKCGHMVNMSYSYFSRCFKKITGRGFKEYLNEIRINHAEQMLVTTELSVTQIALECGYNNVSYFITVYKKWKGKTPFADRKAELN